MTVGVESATSSPAAAAFAAGRYWGCRAGSRKPRLFYTGRYADKQRVKKARKMHGDQLYPAQVGEPLPET